MLQVNYTAAVSINPECRWIYIGELTPEPKNISVQTEVNYTVHTPRCQS